MAPRLAAQTLPAGAWAVGVSGGADSVALTRLLAARHAAAGDCRLVLAHVDHQLRGDASRADAAFVADLGTRLGLPTESATLAAVEGDHAGPVLPNASARYRAARLAWFADVVRRHELDGVLLAHHADDQAETVLLRLQRGRGLAGLGGMRGRQVLRGAPPAFAPLPVFRPLLGVRRDDLRAYLRSIAQPWREDASNDSPDYRRNVLRRWLAERPHLTPALLRLAEASAALRERLAAAPPLPTAFPRTALAGPPLAAEHAARRWLLARGCPPDRVSPAVCQRLIAQALDVTAPPRQHYPGNVLVRRRAGVIDIVVDTVVNTVVDPMVDAGPVDPV